MSFADRFAKLSTGAKLLLILTAAILPIGIATRNAIAPSTPPIAEALRLAPSASPARPILASG